MGSRSRNIVINIIIGLTSSSIGSETLSRWAMGKSFTSMEMLMKLTDVVIGLLDGGFGLYGCIIFVEDCLQETRWDDRAHIWCTSACL